MLGYTVYFDGYMGCKLLIIVAHLVTMVTLNECGLKTTILGARSPIYIVTFSQDCYYDWLWLLRIIRHEASIKVICCESRLLG